MLLVAPGAPRSLPILYAAAAALAAVALWGFTVDDALISVQYARHVVDGVGWRFDPGGPATDGVTPLPWPVVLAPLAKGSALEVLLRARVLGAVLWVAAAAALGHRIAQTSAPRWAKLGGALVLGLSVPAAAHAVSGMETALVLFLATLAATTDRDRAAALFAGAAAAFRPEMVPWALAYVALRPAANGRARATCVALAAALPLAVVAVRLACFGHAAPLAIHAKPADLGQGFAYAIAAVMSSATLWFGVSIVGIRSGGRSRALVVAYVVHALAVAAAGGDWMPLARLVAPVAPGILLAFALAAADVPRWSVALRGVLFATFGWVPLLVGFTARRVYADRRDLVERASPAIASCNYIAAADVGWVSAAAPPSARVLDLGGLTDPEIAYLPGSHTSKRVDASMLLDRKVDCVLLYADAAAGSLPDPDRWREAPFAHVVDARLARSELFADRYAATVFLSLGRALPDGTPARGYYLVRLRPPSE